MAMQARHHSHDYILSRGGSLLLDEHVGCVPTSPAVGIGDITLVPSDFPGDELPFGYGFLPRKRARMAHAGSLLEDQRVALHPAAVMQGLVQLPMTARTVIGSGAAAASKSGREIDALIRVESERMRAVLETACRRHARALVSTLARAATGRMRAAESELDRALRRNAELEEKARQMGAECQAWMGVARSHEAVAAGLQASLDQHLHQSPPASCEGEGEAEDARSCWFEAPPACADHRAQAARKCKACGGGEACVLLLSCRHLCLCRACEPAVDACPVCAAAKNASLLVLVS